MKPELAEGFSWGSDLTLADLLPGDHFQAPRTPKRGETGGKITKIGRVNVQYEAPYMRDMVLSLTIRKTEIIGGYVLRGKHMHEVKL